MLQSCLVYKGSETKGSPNAQGFGRLHVCAARREGMLWTFATHMRVDTSEAVVLCLPRFSTVCLATVVRGVTLKSVKA